MSTTANDNKEPVTYQQAVEMIGDGERIHTVRNSTVGLILGADWPRTKLLKAIKKYGCEISGPMATSMGHGLVLFDERGPLFIETLNTPEREARASQ